ncbi:phosphate ABC transporter substrate-binding protein [Chryseobacterium tructae]|uniref:Phosphate ABC transporter substrate-binding protein n=1 Tax=Chryseobacterium tructae TaxID=1037380 RepID=A0ABV7Y4H8_9FLAO|nr:phosphate ABC transporter substrate-binding protein [Chryseobacterium tructae]MDN3694750.1 phosphate ABC transporter substrate-binding protein [Chryseobacterium tructae]
MKKIKTLRQKFGINEDEWIDFPKKISGIQISRIQHGDDLGCSYCFPHGLEVVNAKDTKFQRNWKKYRRTQWKN